ncbi:MAG: ribosomal protein S18-alanine N-acetyltransferase, partial [Solobacterium sp.]|nr:ribosomal protein S18-alanine N-acetyltransferase [Solobacterium sp.]
LVIAELEKELFPESPWSVEEFLKEKNLNPFCELYVEEEEGMILGYLDFWILYEQAQIANIAVAKKAQRKGIGAKFIDFAINKAIQKKCETISLEVRTTNIAAIALYEKFGFENVAIRKQYYENGEDAYLMVKAIGGFEDDDDLSD